MKRIRITQNGRFLTEAGLADRYFLRLRGLIGRDAEALGGLWITPCGQIHTFMMSVPIDVVYLDREGTVLRVDEALPPSRFFAPVRGARRVLELPAGRAGALGIEPGLALEFQTLPQPAKRNKK